MNTVIQFLKFLCYCVCAVAEFILKLLLDIILQAKKAFQ